MNQQSFQPVSLSINHAVREPDGRWWIGGVCAGRRIATGLFAESVANCRYMIRSTRGDPSFAKRLGEVFGGRGRFQAVTVRGDHVGMASSLESAAEILAARQAMSLQVTSGASAMAATAEHC